MSSTPRAMKSIRRPSRAAGRLFPAAVAMTALTLAGCGDDVDDASHVTSTTTAASAECEAPATPVAVEGPIAAFDLTGVAVPTSSTEEGGYFVVEAIADGAIPDLTTSFLDIVDKAGYDSAGTDDEGFEAEVFFARGQVAAGQIVMEQSEECDNLVEVKLTLLDDPSVLDNDGSSAEPTATTS